MSRVVKIVLGVILVVAVAAGSFYGGMVYGKGQAESQFVLGPDAGAGATVGQGGRQFDAGQGGPGGRRLGTPGAQGGMVLGEITEIKAGVLVVTDANGKQTQVRVTDTTLIEKNASVALADLQQGETVLISGAADSDGSITARSVQVAPAGRMGVFSGAPTR